MVQPSEAEPKLARRRRRPAWSFDLHKRSGPVFALEPHICRFCLARVVSTQGKEEERVFRCTNCGAQATGSQVRAVCVCGTRIGNKDAGMRCVVNTMPTPECMSEIIAKETG